LRVLHIINNLGSGGAEKLLEESLPLMNNIEGVRVDVLLLTDKNNVFDQKLKEEGVKVDVIPLRRIYSLFNILYIKKYIVEGNYDIVHAHLFPTQYWVAIASMLIKNKKIKFVTTEHSTNNRRMNKFYFKPIEKFVYSRYDCVISVNDKVQENIISWICPNKIEKKKYKVIRNGVNVEKFRNAIPYKKDAINNKFTDETKLVCMVGRFSEQKDQSALIRAMKKLPSDIHLLLIGEGPLKEKNESLAREIGVEDRVHFFWVLV